ncbi:hypothetical protein GCM10010261_00750 [Streptomyces pilosus]|uniref:Uncharacterized protein n=1 Tax=Streptomyces pilosus TaxID=28893 RepID=A0A918C3R4_9ACTN|nr:hypothetical protein GCM10010280_61870 [Streptomyces pilosus]GGV33007.1 hypothetical protein GCM10010261_00750 [Streptomyces pilosus]
MESSDIELPQMARGRAGVRSGAGDDVGGAHVALGDGGGRRPGEPGPSSWACWFLHTGGGRLLAHGGEWAASKLPILTTPFT